MDYGTKNDWDLYWLTWKDVHVIFLSGGEKQVVRQCFRKSTIFVNKRSHLKKYLCIDMYLYVFVKIPGKIYTKMLIVISKWWDEWFHFFLHISVFKLMSLIIVIYLNFMNFFLMICKKDGMPLLGKLYHST